MKKIFQTKSGSKLLFDILNAREIKLHKEDGTFNFINTVNEKDGKILSIQYDNMKISIDEDFTIDNETYHITSINSDKDFYTFYTSKINKITLFSLPMFFDNRDIASTSNLINVHYGYEGYSPPNDNLHFHYRYSTDIQFKETQRTITENEYFIKETEVDAFHTVYEAEIPTEYLIDFRKIIDGQYSKISSAYRNKIVKFHSLKTNKYLYQVLYRSKILLDKMEKDLDVKIPEEVDLMSKIDLNKVKFNPKNTIKNKEKIKQ